MAVLEVENGVRSLFIFPDISSGFQCARNPAMTYERNAGLPSTFMPWYLASMRRRRVLACARWGSYLPFVRFLFNSSEILPELRLRTRAISRMPYCFSRKSAISRRSVLLILGLLCIHYGLYRSVRIQNGMDDPENQKGAYSATPRQGVGNGYHRRTQKHHPRMRRADARS